MTTHLSLGTLILYLIVATPIFFLLRWLLTGIPPNKTNSAVLSATAPRW